MGAPETLWLWLETNWDEMRRNLGCVELLVFISSFIHLFIFLFIFIFIFLNHHVCFSSFLLLFFPIIHGFEFVHITFAFIVYIYILRWFPAVGTKWDTKWNYCWSPIFVGVIILTVDSFSPSAQTGYGCYWNLEFLTMAICLNKPYHLLQKEIS